MKAKKVIIKIIITLSIFVVCISGYLIYEIIVINENTIVTNKLEELGYSDDSIQKLIDKYKIFDTVIKNDYSKTLDIALQSDEFNENNLDLYLYIKYLDKDDYISMLNKLSILGYNFEEIEKIIDKVNYDDIIYISDSLYIDNILNYLEYSNFDIKKLNRYINYSNDNSDKDLESVINYVNMDIDKIPYIDYEVVTNADSELVLINKYNKLPDDYEPNDLERINTNYSVKNLYLRKNAKEAFEAMCRDASALGLNIRAVSSYRTFDYQKELYDYYVNKNSVEEADTYSARPGFSEHETGLAIDIMGKNGNYNIFSETNEYTWVVNNAHNYGFIIRYPKGKEDITKYMFEAWHIRYVGIDNAKNIYDNNLTLEEYIANKE